MPRRSISEAWQVKHEGDCKNGQKDDLGRKKVPRGTRMATGKGWRLRTPSGNFFKAALLKTLKIDGERVAIFRVAP